MNKLALVRHGRTAWNDEQRIQGRIDIPLSPEGRESIHELLSFLTSIGPAAVYSSPVRRAVESAEIIAHHLGLTVLLRDAFTELDVGEWQGMIAADLSATDSWQEYQTDPSVARPRGGESLMELQTRALCGIDSLIASSAANCIVVTHGDVIRAIACHYARRALSDLHAFRVPLGSAFILELSSGAVTSFSTYP